MLITIYIIFMTYLCTFIKDYYSINLFELPSYSYVSLYNQCILLYIPIHLPSLLFCVVCISQSAAPPDLIVLVGVPLLNDGHDEYIFFYARGEDLN